MIYSNSVERDYRPQRNRENDSTGVGPVLMSVEEDGAELALLVLFEEFRDLRMAQRLSAIVFEQVLFRHVRDVFRLIVLGEKVVEWLILARALVFRNGKPPFFGVGEFWINIEDETAKRVVAVAYDITHVKFRGSDLGSCVSHRSNDCVCHLFSRRPANRDGSCGQGLAGYVA